MPSKANEPRWGDPPWHVPVQLPTRPAPRQSDVAVIGAGFAGLSAAYHLARRGAQVAVLEASALGAGASGRTGGLVLEGTAAGPLDQVERCIDALSGVVEQAGIACDLTLPGCWQVHHVEPAGGHPGWRDGDGWIVRSGSESGGTVDPGALLSGLAVAARAAGAEIYPHTPARAIAADGPAYRVSCGGSEILTATHVIVALNAYTAQLVALPEQFHPSLTLAVCTAAVDEATLATIGFAERVPFYTVDLPYLWGRCLPDRRLIVGAGLLFPHDGDVRSVDLTASESAHSMARLAERVRGLHPLLVNLEITHRWGGPIAFRHGGVPILTRLPHLPGVITFGGCAGHGVALSVRVGEVIAAAVVDGAPLPAWGALSV